MEAAISLNWLGKGQSGYWRSDKRRSAVSQFLPLKFAIISEWLENTALKSIIWNLLATFLSGIPDTRWPWRLPFGRVAPPQNLQVIHKFWKWSSMLSLSSCFSGPSTEDNCYDQLEQSHSQEADDWTTTDAVGFCYTVMTQLLVFLPETSNYRALFVQSGISLCNGKVHYCLCSGIFNTLFSKTQLLFTSFPTAKLKVDWQLHKR